MRMSLVFGWIVCQKFVLLSMRIRFDGTDLLNHEWGEMPRVHRKEFRPVGA